MQRCCLDLALWDNTGLLWRRKIELPHRVPLHHINVPAWSCAGLDVDAALCGFAWYTCTLSVLLSILFYPWVQLSHPAEHGRGRWECMGAHPIVSISYTFLAPRAPVNIAPITPAHLVHGVPSAWSETGYSRWQDAFAPCPWISLCWASLPVHTALGMELVREGKASVGRNDPSHLVLFLGLFLPCVMGRQLVACQGLPRHLTCSQSAGQKTLLCSVPYQTWCFRLLVLVWLCVWRGPATRRSSYWLHLWCQGDCDIPTSARDLLREMKSSNSFWGGAAWQCWCIHHGSSFLSMLLQHERNICASSRMVFLFPLFNELMTSSRDAAIVMGTFCSGTCSFWQHVGKYSCAHGVPDTCTFCSIRIKKKQTRITLVIPI